MLMEMRMSFVNTFENQDRRIKHSFRKIGILLQNP